ncbi:spherulin-2A-like [Microplitis mediator]|uniref:spherulin-2A-like n=1 Tax=Microplitis mediator TaxID=375433 RepID=UPI0025557347|nr:spherulin-2A-like [Microplitis mediator]XP_057338849.1 spherulin-2A-like [Microplitis mediator]XP_057338858.1 spherulin-2A-like [Microplitis mediator]XP_057338866.1 spherulin-2A-like [Microplitis mediator]
MGLSIEIKEIGDNEFKIKASGYISSLITDADRRKFGVDDDDIKEAVDCYKGKRPTDVYLRSPTPWGDMYDTYDLDQTEKVIRVIKTKVISVSSRPEIVTKATLNNTESAEPTTFNTSIEKTVTNSVSSSWKNENNISISRSVGYDIKAAKGDISFSYSKNWGSTEIKSKAVTLKSASSVQKTLGPGKSATIELMAHRKVAKIEITYECSLEGDVGINYHERYKGYHFHFVPIDTIMEAGDIDNSLMVKEIIELELYSDTTINVKS